MKYKFRRAYGWFRNIPYAVRCFFRPYNVVKVKALDRGWCDRDVLMFHAMFQVLVDFVEKEHPFGEGTTLREMQAWNETNHNTPEGLASFYFEGMTPDEQRKTDAHTRRTYQINREILYLYEWYKDERYEFDILAFNAVTGMKYVFNKDGRLEQVPNGTAALITTRELLELEDEHRVICDTMLRRILDVRRHLWT
jgi:hypothetical protein